MRIVGLKTIQHSTRWIRSRFVGGAVILAYHRVGEIGWDPFELNVSTRNFEEHLRVLRERANLMTLGELVDASLHDRVPPASVAITFDDGYVDNLHGAKVLLETYRIPATVFIVTGNLGRAFWWDEVADAFRPTLSLPNKLRINCNGRVYEQTMRSGVDARKRKQLVRSVYDFLRNTSGDDRRDGIEQLRMSIPRIGGRQPDIRAMTASEIIELAAGNLVEVGAHTVTHPFLATLTLSAQRDEIQQSKVHLERILGSKVASFSFPNGSLAPETLGIVRECGFSFACASHTDIVWRGSDCFCLPRFWPRDWSGARFSAWLDRWIR